MDTTKEYFEQCSKADEIQNKWKFELGDYFTTPQMNAHFTTPFMDDDFCIVDDFWIEDELTKRTLSDRMKTRAWVWLPRQDQLQDMINWEKDGHFGVVLIDAFYDFAKRIHNSEPFNNTKSSWEQLWLEFTMYEKFNKIWIKNEWVKQ